jgi:hypothetical protein
MKSTTNNYEDGERMYIPPFELKGIQPNVQLDRAEPESHREAYARYIRLGDKLEAFVDALTSRETIQGLTVIEHLALSRTKVETFTKGRSLEGLIEIGAFIGPCVVAVHQSTSEHCEEFVRLGIFLPNPPRM